MPNSKHPLQERKNQILDLAVDLIIQYGYDKITMSDIADQAGVTRAIVYIHFDSKESLFEALLYRETQKYFQTWLEAIESDLTGGTIAGVFRSVLAAINRSPFISALLKQDPRVFGRYLRKPGNLFEAMQSSTIWEETLQAMQAVEAVRKDIEPAVMAHIMNALAVGLLVLSDSQSFGDPPPFDRILETVTIIMERTLTTPEGGNPAAGKRVLMDLATSARTQFEQARKIINEGR